MRARLIYAASETDADLLYATGFLAPDPFLFIETGRRRLVAVSDLERGRARHHARVDEVLAWSRFAPGPSARPARVIAAILAQLRVRRVRVPASFPLRLGLDLRGLGIGLEVSRDPFWPEREIKRAEEIRAIRAALRAAEDGLQAGVDALRACRIGRDGYLYRSAARFTAEDLRAVIDRTVVGLGCVPSHTICAPGDQAVDPHETGHGPLRGHEPVVIDVFPRSARTGYWGDLTRTVVRGRASEAVKTMYALVAQAVGRGFARARPGIDGREVHAEIQALFVRHGYKTGVQQGRMQGFFHGTGHGVGMQIHERPSIGRRHSVLRAGHVVTIEPGLYYLGLGGVRLEDMALVTAHGARDLTRLPKVLEI